MPKKHAIEEIMINRIATFFAVGVTVSVIALPLIGQATDYSGQQHRDLKSLSQADVDDLENGRGWGLAKPAELNGLPGPIHLLEYKTELDLSEQQIDAITNIYAMMNEQAKKLGQQYIKQERQLENLLLAPRVSEEELQAQIHASAKLRGELRYTHLRAHLKTPNILSVAQIDKYNALRGYVSKNPCDNPPSGHDVTMWKKHNNCS